MLFAKQQHWRLFHAIVTYTVYIRVAASVKKSTQFPRLSQLELPTVVFNPELLGSMHAAFRAKLSAMKPRWRLLLDAMRECAS